MRGKRPIAAAAIVFVLAAGTSACRDRRQNVFDQARTLTGGDPGKGMVAIDKYGCGGCHTIPGVAGANATVGPPLTNIASRSILGGHLTNTPDNMMRWIKHPQQIDPKNVMPDMGVNDQDARDITAYLYTLR
ncbi:MAG TPA: c-type cytochrome [Vicinamibacterales bacterium]|jgi:cytochrome c|nr:c-type cytochrome [Vicinamibacterales bacterium]